ncbi:FHA domain-containing protein [Candidatus Woesearchaeota archaeon]|nr:MAG: FHA domain-containing protein [Candidatus Woesearchaeota archaeon]
MLNMAKLISYLSAQKNNLCLESFLGIHRIYTPVLVQTRGVMPKVEESLSLSELGFKTAAPGTVDYSQFREYKAPYDIRVHTLEKRAVGGLDMFISLGRAENNDIILDHKAASIVCAVFSKFDGFWTMKNLARDGTVYNGEKLDYEDTLRLNDNDVINFAGEDGFSFTYLTPEAFYDYVKNFDCENY